MEREVPSAIVVVATLALALAGCVADADGPSPTDPHGFTTTTTIAVTTTTLSMEAALAGYRECMSDEGVVVDEIPLDGLGRPLLADALVDVDLSDREVLDALEVCGHILSSGTLESGSDPKLRALVQTRLEEFAECVRLEGVDEYPDPVPDFDGVGAPFPVNRVPWSDPRLPSAVESCTPDLASR